MADPNTHNNKLATYHSCFAIPSSIYEREPTTVPRYLHLHLSKHAMRNVSKLTFAYFETLIEAAARLEGGSRICNQCPGEDEHAQNEVHALLFDHWVCEMRKHFPFLFIPFLRTFHQQPNPFCCNRSTTNLFIPLSSEH